MVGTVAPTPEGVEVDVGGDTSFFPSGLEPDEGISVEYGADRFVGAPKKYGAGLEEGNSAVNGADGAVAAPDPDGAGVQEDSRLKLESSTGAWVDQGSGLVASNGTAGANAGMVVS